MHPLGDCQTPDGPDVREGGQRATGVDPLRLQILAIA